MLKLGDPLVAADRSTVVDVSAPEVYCGNENDVLIGGCAIADELARNKADAVGSRSVDEHFDARKGSFHVSILSHLSVR